MDYGARLLDSFRATLVEGNWRTADEIIANASDADAVVCIGSLQSFDRRVISSLPKCRILASLGIAYEQIDIQAANEHGIVVTNTPDYCIDEVSGRAVAFMLALGHKLFQFDKVVRESQAWFVPPNRKAVMDIAYPLFRMRDQTLGIVGLGRLGLTTAEKARGLGMRVIGYDPYVLNRATVNRQVPLVNFDNLLEESDFISIHAPLTDQTRNMFGYEEFKKMKRTSFIINTARGELVDQSALIQALDEGLIAGAGLDVTIDEPIATDNPLLAMSNVILTGHSGWYSTAADSMPEFWGKPMAQVAMALEGNWPTYAVNLQIKDKWLGKWGYSGKTPLTDL